MIRVVVGRSVLEGFHLFRDSPVPAFLQLKSQVEYLIASGELESGAKLPSIREVARSLAVGTATVVHAYRELESAGLVVAVEGVGCFVVGVEEATSQIHVRMRHKVTQLLEEAMAHGVSPEQLLKIVVAQVAEARVVLNRPDVVLIGKRAARLSDMAMHLRHGLANAAVDVTSVAIEDVAEDVDGWLPRLNKARVVLCPLFNINEVRQMLAPHGISVVPMLASLRDDVRERIIHLPVGTRIGVVASKLDFVDGMVNAINSLNSALEIVGLSDADDVSGVDALIRSCDCLIYGTLTRSVVERHLLPSTEGVEFVYVPDGLSVARLRSLLQTSEPTK
jgi:DNA-binding transcriptional regulator YhcF (GntR family)